MSLHDAYPPYQIDVLLESGEGVETSPMTNAVLSSKGRALTDTVAAKAKYLKVP